MDELSKRFTAGDDEMMLCDCLCDVCIFRRKDDPDTCEKFPAGKPEDAHEEEFYCDHFSSLEQTF